MRQPGIVQKRKYRKKRKQSKKYRHLQVKSLRRDQISNILKDIHHLVCHHLVCILGILPSHSHHMVDPIHREPGPFLEEDLCILRDNNSHVSVEREKRKKKETKLPMILRMGG